MEAPASATPAPLSTFSVLVATVAAAVLGAGAASVCFMTGGYDDGVPPCTAVAFALALPVAVTVFAFLTPPRRLLDVPHAAAVLLGLAGGSFWTVLFLLIDSRQTVAQELLWRMFGVAVAVSFVFSLLLAVTGHLVQESVRRNRDLQLALEELRTSEAKQTRAREQLTQLANRIEAVREEERTVLAREIHDVLGQALTAIKLDLNWVRDRAGSEQELDDERLDSMIRLVDETMDAVRRLSTRLRPTVLDDLGLKPALDWQVREFSQRTDCACRVSVLPEDLAPDDARDTALFRILQEALTNVTRHAEARSVTVRLDRVADDLRLTVQDDGRGIRRTEIEADGSLGLLGMRERVDALGGRFKVTPADGGGTIVTASIPMARQSRGEST